MSEEVLTQAIMDGLNASVDQAICLPNAAYTSEAFLEREREALFDRGWTYAAVGAQLPARGDAFPVEVAGRPILLTRDRDGQVHAFHNVCRHRGLQLVSEPQHGKPTLVCPYHSWTYALNGDLKKTPHFCGPDCHDGGSLDRSEYGLMKIRCEMWHDLIFVNLSGDAGPLSDVMGPLEQRWADYDFSLLRYGGSASFDIETNWKLAVENWVESYHLPWTHHTLNSISDMSVHYSMLEDTYLGQGSNTYDADVGGHPDLPIFPGLSEEKKAVAEYPYVSPNLNMGIHPSFFFVFSMQPVGPEKTHEEFHFYFVGDEAMTDELAEQRQRVIETWKEINGEDIGMLVGMQKGRHSPGYRNGKFSPYHESTTHEFQRRLANVCVA